MRRKATPQVTIGFLYSVYRHTALKIHACPHPHTDAAVKCDYAATF